ncbi:hypothetical protein BDW75DRAFT_237395 [Aspergillus navahoensis]
MDRLVTLVRSGLVLLALLAFYTVWITSIRKGLLAGWIHCELAGELSGNPDARLLDSFTGLKIPDIVIKRIITSFWPACNGQNLSLSLLTVPFVATVGVSYILLALDARRTKSPFSLGLRLACLYIFQNYGSMALTLPIYCAVILAPKKFSERQRPAPFRSIPYLLPSLLLGYYMPLPLIALSSPRTTSYELKQVLLAAMVGWSLWLFLMLWAASHFRVTDSADNATAKNRRPLYLFALVTATISHLGALIIPFLSRDYDHVLLPSLPWSIEHFTTFEDGITNFLQWDYWISSLALLLWALGVYIRDCGEAGALCRLVAGSLGLSIVASPTAAAVVLLWRLDMRLEGREKVE